MPDGKELVEEFRLSPEWIEWAKMWKQYQAVANMLTQNLQIVGPTQQLQEALGMTQEKQMQLLNFAPQRPTKELEGQDSEVPIYPTKDGTPVIGWGPGGDPTTAGEADLYRRWFRGDRGIFPLGRGR